MTLTSTARLVSYNGTGTAGPFPYPFKIFADTDLEVTHIDVTGVETVLVLGTGYTVTGAGNRTGGNVTLTFALAIGETLVIERVVTLTQTVPFRTQGKFSASSHEDAFDKVTMALQQHDDTLDRSLKVSKTSAAGTTVPEPVDGQTLGWTGTTLSNLGRVAGPQGDRGPAGAGGPIPIVTDDAGRDVLYPIPAVDNMAFNKARGYLQRWGPKATGGNTWLNTGITRDAGSVITAQSKGLVADGFVDDTPFLAAADVAAVASGGRHEIDVLLATQVKVNIASDLTLNAPFRPTGRNLINVALNKTLTINGHFDPGLYRVFDPTMLGKVVINSERDIAAEWFGCAPNTGTDMTPTCTFAVACTPDYCTLRFTLPGTYRLKSRFETAGRRGVHIIATPPSFPDGSGVAFIWWGPAWVGGTDLVVTAGSAVVNTTLGLFTAAMVGERLVVGAEYDTNNEINKKIIQYNSPTQVVLESTMVHNAGPQPYTVGGIAVMFASCDHCVFRNFMIRPNDLSAVQDWGGYITAGTNILHNAGGLDLSAIGGGAAGKMIRVEGAGLGGTDLITTIQSVTDAHTLVLNANAGTTIANNVLTVFIIGAAADTLPALFGVMSDLTGQNATGTNCYFIGNLWHTTLNYPWTGLSLSRASQGNQEYHRVLENTFNGGNSGGLSTLFRSITTTLGAPSTVTSSGASFSPFSVGVRLRIPGAGPAGGLLDTKIIGYTNANTVTVKDNASTAVAGVTALIGTWRGIGIDIGHSANVKKITIRDNIITFWDIAIRQRNGSYESISNSFTTNNIDQLIEDATEPSFELMGNVEHSLQHLVHQAGMPFSCRSTRFGDPQPLPGKPYIDSNTGGPVEVAFCTDDSAHDTGGVFYGFNSSNNRLVSRGNHWPNITMAVLGLTDALASAVDASYSYEDEYGITDMPAMSGRRSSQQLDQSWASVTAGPITVREVVLATRGGFGGGSGAESQALRALIEPTAVTSIDGPLAAVCAAIALNYGNTLNGTGEISLFRARMPVRAFGADNHKFHAFLAESIDIHLGGTINDVYGMRIKDQTGPSGGRVTRGHGLWQEGTGDQNLLAGRTFQAMPSTAPADADINPGTTSFYLDEVGNTRKARVRYSGGTYKTETSSGLV